MSILQVTIQYKVFTVLLVKVVLDRWTVYSKTNISKSAPTVKKGTGWDTLLVAQLILLGKHHHRAELVHSKPLDARNKRLCEKAVLGKGLFCAPAHGEEAFPACSAPNWAWTAQAWRLLLREDPFQPPLEPHWSLIQESWHYYDSVNGKKYYEGLSHAVHKWMLPWGEFATGWNKRCQVILLWEKKRRGTDKQK